MIKTGKFLKLAVFILIILVIISVLNIEVITRQGVNYQWRSIKIPLYLKILDFFDRNYNYKRLVRDIIRDCHSERKKALRILEWTNDNIRRVPDNFPVVDDHVWYIIVRGYGAMDQSNDVFSTLCNYAGLNAFYKHVGTPSQNISLSFVKFNNGWRIFDSYNGYYFVNSDGGFATFHDIKIGNWQAINIKTGTNKKFDHKPYLINLPEIKEGVLVRSNIQSPLKRFLFEVKRLNEKPK